MAAAPGLIVAAPPARHVRWFSYAACVWCIGFGAPHFWWALVGDRGFPGGPASYEFFMSSAWRVVYLWVVNACVILGILVALVLLKPRERVARRWVPHAAAWIACGLLAVRGVAGLIVDGFVKPFWTVMFVAGGAVFGGVAWFARRPREGA